MDPTQMVADLTTGALQGGAQALRELADKIDAAAAGDPTALTDREVLQGFQVLSMTVGQVGVLRRIRDAETRRAQVIPLDARRAP